MKNVLIPLGLLLLMTPFQEVGYAKKGGTDRPFKGYALSTVTQFSVDNPAPQVFAPSQCDEKDILGYFDVQYVGEATQMGEITRQEYAVLYTDGSFEGIMFFVAANGDELVALFEGGLESLAPPSTGSGCYTFIGGTGRFAEASGETCFELYTPDFTNISVMFDGKISF